jgi:hypothetical protein
MKQLGLQPATHVLQPQAQIYGTAVVSTLKISPMRDFNQNYYVILRPALRAVRSDCQDAVRREVREARRHWLEAYPTFTQQANQKLKAMERVLIPCRNQSRQGGPCKYLYWLLQPNNQSDQIPNHYLEH